MGPFNSIDHITYNGCTEMCIINTKINYNYNALLFIYFLIINKIK